MFLKSFSCGPILTNCYFLGCEKTRKAIVVDAPKGAFSILSQTQEPFEFEKLVLTHSHWDHVFDAALIQKNLKLPVWMKKEDVEYILEPADNGIPILKNEQSFLPDHLVEDGEVFRVGEISIQIIHTPGHSPGGICLYIEKENVLISGDTLFAGSCGRVDFPSSNPEAMWASLEKLSKLPKKTKVYPGHGESTILEWENWMKDARQLFGG